MTPKHRIRQAILAFALAAVFAFPFAAVALAAGPTVAVTQPNGNVRSAVLKFSGVTDTGTLTVTLSCDNGTTESAPIAYATSLPVSLDVCQGYGNFTLWVTVHDDAVIVLRQNGDVTISPTLTIEMPLPAITGQSFTIQPTYPSDYALPAGSVCRFEFRWGDNRALVDNVTNETFGALGFDAPAANGSCPTWTFTLPWVPYPQFQIVVSIGLKVGNELAWRDGDEGVRFPAAIDGTNPRITSSNLPIVQVLPSTYTPIVGQSITYTRYLVHGATVSPSDRWDAWQNVGGQHWQQYGGSTFTIRPSTTGSILVNWQRISGPLFYGSFDPPVRYRDRTPPTVTAPLARIGAGGLESAVPVSLTWSGHDVGWGIGSYQVDRSVDGGAWRRVTTTKTKTLAQSLASGHVYRYRVRAIDKYGNVGAWATGATLRPTIVPDGVSSIQYKGPWQVTADASAAGGSLHESGAAGASLTYTFTGRAFAFVAERGPTHGQARVYVDGTLVTTVDLKASADWARRIVMTRSWTTASQHLVRILVLGTAGRPLVSVDAFLVLR